MDVHTHVFPSVVETERARFLAADATFRELYADPKAKVASAEELLASMTAAGIDVSVALGFAWGNAGMVRLHNDYLLESAAASEGRIVAFCSLPLGAGDAAIEAEMRRCVASGARGFGELRPDNLGFDIAGEAGARLGALARELDVTLLFHASEPVGHAYPGKAGGGIASLYDFVRANLGTRVILAHLGGGLPFYAHMPEVLEALREVRFDTAACNYLYGASGLEAVTSALGPGCLLFGSDFPLVSQTRALRWVEGAVRVEVLEAVVGDNASAWLGL